MYSRSFNSSTYRYGFNSQEKDDEISGEGNSLVFMYRIYNPRIARFLSVDPLTFSYPWYSPYQFAGNTPIQAKDLEGREPEFVIREMADKGLRATELQVAWGNPWSTLKIHISGNREIAEKVAENSPLPGLHNGPADALRHALFNALNTQEVGEEIAKAFGDAHEEDRPGQPAQEKIMDLHNNEVGRKLAKESPSSNPLTLAEKLIEKIEAGDLMMLDDNGNAVPTEITPETTNEAKEQLENSYLNGEQIGENYGEDEEG
jgi:RHS repeat-associated protein